MDNIENIEKEHSIMKTIALWVLYVILTCSAFYLFTFPRSNYRLEGADRRDDNAFYYLKSGDIVMFLRLYEGASESFINNYAGSYKGFSEELCLDGDVSHCIPFKKEELDNAQCP